MSMGFVASLKEALAAVGSESSVDVLIAVVRCGQDWTSSWLCGIRLKWEECVRGLQVGAEQLLNSNGKDSKLLASELIRVLRGFLKYEYSLLMCAAVVGYACGYKVARDV